MHVRALTSRGQAPRRRKRGPLVKQPAAAGASTSAAGGGGDAGLEVHAEAQEQELEGSEGGFSEEEDDADGSDDDAAVVGPSVFVHATGKFEPPVTDVRVVDARGYKLTARAGDNDDAADALLPAVSAFVRETKRPMGTRGRLAHDLAEIEALMELAEREEEEAAAGAGGKATPSGVAAVLGRGTSSVRGKLRAIAGAMVDGREVVESRLGLGNDAVDDEETDWDEWFDGFVEAAAKDDAAFAGAIPEGDEEGESGDGASEGGASEDPEGDHEDGDRAAAALRQAGASARAGGSATDGGVAHSFASSYWRPERSDRKGELGGLDDRFEVLAAQYEDEEVGELDPDGDGDGLGALGGGAAAKARGTARISDFAGLMDEFLAEQAEMERALDAADGSPAAGSRGGAAAQVGGAHEDHVGGDEYDDIAGLGGSDDEGERASVASAARARGDGGAHGGNGPSVEMDMRGMHAMPSHLCRKMESLDVADAAAVAKTRERLAAAEVAAALHGGVSVLGGGTSTAPDGAVPLGDVFDVEVRQVVVERDDRWDCESVLSLRSNSTNHPGRIAEPQARIGDRKGGAIKINAKTGMPSSMRVEATAAGGAIPEGDEDADESGSEASSGGHVEDGEEGRSAVIMERKKGETAEEKKARKSAVKDGQRAARASKKELKTMYKEEGLKQKKQAASTRGAGSTFAIA
ncbi:hypothetical protein FOA52_003467 [Chlamydomonas sp. UWO 241]|nr:hypothetical protein FOA52_003467 [Chlamydomonas sp. UWO 241]